MQHAGFRAGTDAVPIAGYTVLDFFSTVQIGRSELILGVQNLLNQQDQTVNAQLEGAGDPALNLPARGRTFRLTYRVRW